MTKTERAKQYSDVLRKSADVPVDIDDEIDMKLPDFADHEKIKRAQAVFKNNFFAIFFGMYCGLLAILAIPTILNVLVHTKKSGSDMTAYKRYMRTIYHTLTWFRNDLKPGTTAWKSLSAVRKFHLSASRSAKGANVGMISQRDMAITQYGFIGFSILGQKMTGVQATKEEMDDYCHLWRVIGHVLGISDNINLCAETFEETLERLNVVQDDFLRPALQFPPKDFQPMTRYIANGLWCFNPRDAYDVIIFIIKRMVGVPNFYYHEEEIPKDFNDSNLEIYKLGYYDRFTAWFVVFTHEYLLQFFIIRWFFNLDTIFHEYLITYFPFLAFYQFGWKNAYVPGYQSPTCAKCCESITRTTAPQQFYQHPPVQSMAPPLLHIPTATGSNDHQQQLGTHTAHQKKFTATTATNTTSTFELEQALINMDGEILLGEEGQCPLCQKIFNRKTSLLNHIRNHSADKKYVCGYCQKGFSQQANLRNHERIHTNDRPYVCIDCGKAFTQITNLNNHRRLHTGERPFVCIEVNCGRSFAQVTNLNNHMKTHHKIQQYVCSQCPKNFHTVTQLNHHLGTHGITVKTQIAPRGEFSCNLCPTFFNDEAQLKRHIQRHADGRYFACSVVGCSEGFSSKNQLNKHLQHQHPHDFNRRRDRQVPLSLLQLSGNSNFDPSKTKIKIEEDLQISAQNHHVAQIPLQIGGQNVTINLSSPYHHHQPQFRNEHLISNGMSSANDHTKKVLSDHLSNFNHFLNSFNAPAMPNNSSKIVCKICSNVFKTTHTLDKHVQKFHS